jgi:hypothetical protein
MKDGRKKGDTLKLTRTISRFLGQFLEVNLKEWVDLTPAGMTTIGA